MDPEFVAHLKDRGYDIDKFNCLPWNGKVLMVLDIYHRSMSASEIAGVLETPVSRVKDILAELKGPQ